MSDNWDTTQLAQWYSTHYGVSRKRAEDLASAHASIFGAKDPGTLRKHDIRKVKALADYGN